MLRLTQGVIICVGGIWCRCCWIEACTTPSSKSCSKSPVKRDWTRFHLELQMCLQEPHPGGKPEKCWWEVQSCSDGFSLVWCWNRTHTQTDTHQLCVCEVSQRLQRGEDVTDWRTWCMDPPERNTTSSLFPLWGKETLLQEKTSRRTVCVCVCVCVCVW